jgi:hypothetical protein
MSDRGEKTQEEGSPCSLEVTMRFAKEVNSIFLSYYYRCTTFGTDLRNSSASLALIK